MKKKSNKYFCDQLLALEIADALKLTCNPKERKKMLQIKW